MTLITWYDARSSQDPAACLVLEGQNRNLRERIPLWEGLLGSLPGKGTACAKDQNMLFVGCLF